MKLLSLILLAAFESLFANYASSKCQSLNRTLFNGCLHAGYNVSAEFSRSRPQDEVASLISSMQSKFENCSESLSTLMTCSVHVPKCSMSSARLPCNDVCRKFVRDCQGGSSDSEGLLAIFRGLCELPLPTEQCLSSSKQQFNDTGTIDVTCHRLDIRQCADAGYSHTSVSSAYQKKVESSNMFQGSDMNSTLRKIICMEVAPPCDYKNNRTFLVPCKSTCEAAFNESKTQFLEVFRSPYYCSAFPMNETEDGKAYCRLEAWPDAGYWPSDLWRSIGQSFTAEESTNVSTTVPTTKQSRNVSSPVPTTKTTENGSTSVPSTKPSANSSSPATPTKPSANSSSPATPTKASGNGSTPVPTTKPSGNSSSPATPTKPSGNSSSPATPTKPSGNSSSPATPTKPSGNSSSPATPTKPSGNSSSPATPTKTSGNSSSSATPTKPSGNNSSPTPPTKTSGKSSSPSPKSKTSGSTKKSTTDSGSKGSPKIQANKGGGMSAGPISGIVLGVIAIMVAIVVGFVLFRRYKRRKNQYSHSLMVNMDEL